MADDAILRANASDSLALQKAMAAGNVNISGVQADTMELSSNAQAAQERHAFVLAQLEAKRRARSVVLPTADSDVKRMLRSRGHPVCLFGEKPEDRRVRCVCPRATPGRFAAVAVRARPARPHPLGRSRLLAPPPSALSPLPPCAVCAQSSCTRW